ncbi:capsid scaffolding protein [Novosphingobium sp. ST904]|uniref:capsid scaffolding protein n=1 Tax=Novosphingobium sp. ST904 TaxID=1684385 RepID=UPI0006C8B036|nr:capsid scaffolding protein [Novosphingobium sp. ST904]TCM43313.1 capsid scaffolding serine peptidase GPO [Novosphingobium sp. ST904]
MKTKAFLLATSGPTVDGRNIEPKLLTEMAESYNPKTYGARLNIEHIRGATGQAPFRAFGDVTELSTAEVEVDFNGKKEKRTGLYGVFDINEDAKALNDAGQKVYPSIEIEPNFAGKGFAYLMGCALTDSPASIATERLQFNRQLPGTEVYSRDIADTIEFANEGSSASGDSFLTKFGAMLDSFSAKFTPPKAEVTPPKEAEPSAPAAFDFSQIKVLFGELGKSFSDEIGALRTELRSEVDAIGVKLSKVEKVQEETPSNKFSRRPPSDGGAGDFAGVF